jgi:hypothetical protein
VKRSYWTGFLTGAIRGRLSARIRSEDGQARGFAALNDQASGPTLIRFAGKMDAETALIRLFPMSAVGPRVSLDGRVDLTRRTEGVPEPWASDFRGTWFTDAGLGGHIFLRPSSWTDVVPRILLTRLTLFASRIVPVIYVALLVAIAVATLLGRVELSYAALVLLLLPALYVLRRYLEELIIVFRRGGVKRLGFMELAEEQREPTPEISPALLDAQEKSVRFLVLNGFLARATKAVLVILAKRQQVTRKEFDGLALSLGIPTEKVDVTLEALMSSGCVTPIGDLIAITSLGFEYVSWLERTALPPSPFTADQT